MKYKQLLQDKLNQLDSISRNLDFNAKRGNITEYNKYSDILREKVEEIRTLINSQTGEYE